MNKIGLSLLSFCPCARTTLSKSSYEKIDRVKTCALQWIVENQRALKFVFCAVVWKFTLFPIALLVYFVATIYVFPRLAKAMIEKALETGNIAWAARALSRSTHIDTQSKDANGETLLFRMLRMPPTTQRTTCLMQLLAQRADASLVNKDGFTALDLCMADFEAQALPQEAMHNAMILTACGARIDLSLIICTRSIEDIIAMATSAIIMPDPTSPFYEILKQLWLLKDQIPGGADKFTQVLLAEDKGRCTPVPEAPSETAVTAPSFPKFVYIFKMLLAMQELNRPFYQDLIAQHDNLQKFFGNNAARLVFALTGLMPHFDEGNHTKIKQSCDLILNRFQQAKAEGQLLEFFLEGFNEKNTCFEGRMAHFAKYAAKEIDPADFMEEFDNYNSVETKVGEYFRVFRNKQFREMVGDLYAALHEQMTKGTLDIQLQGRFFSEFCTKPRFVQYLRDYAQHQDPELIEAAEWDTGGFFS